MNYQPNTNLAKILVFRESKNLLPIKYNVNLLRERSKDDKKWHIYPYALGQFTEKLPLNVMESNDLSSFSDPSHSFDWDHNAINTVDHVENVEMRRLDNMILEFLYRVLSHIFDALSRSFFIFLCFSCMSQSKSLTLISFIFSSSLQ